MLKLTTLITPQCYLIILSNILLGYDSTGLSGPSYDSNYPSNDYHHQHYRPSYDQGLTPQYPPTAGHTTTIAKPINVSNDLNLLHCHRLNVSSCLTVLSTFCLFFFAGFCLEELFDSDCWSGDLGCGCCTFCQSCFIAAWGC